jgi:hypothetical protein
MMLVALPATLVFRPVDDDPWRRHTEVAGKWSQIALQQSTDQRCIGYIYFMHTGVLFLSASTRLYLPLNIFTKIYLVQTRSPMTLDGKQLVFGDGTIAVSVEAYMPVTEPYLQLTGSRLAT